MMRFQSLICAWLAGMLLLVVPAPVQAAPLNSSASVIRAKTSQTVSPQQVLEELANADVVYLGETHDSPEDHRAQLEILQALHQKRSDWTIGMEMFQRPYQAVLDAYLAGNLTEADLQERSQYKKRWGYSWEFYAEILRFAKAQGLPVIALNTPTEVTRKVSRQGLESLTLSDRRFVPPLSAIELGPPEYRQRMQEVYEQIHQGKSNSLNFERFFQAQVLWDETMAERIAQTLQQAPKTRMLVLVGQGHLFYGDGIPNRVARRVRRPSFSQISVLLNPPDEVRTPSDRPIADYYWMSSQK
ncbi:ChaN family lipoprotein [Leptolyngbya sp. FACHB-36]|uniref:ChaN family lipoprotein n=1 Tax=Leptolyngbya sp. FACHB-36 TaxID=2692808 RepID=UPI0016804DAF|nr:ChaN family lipoprotein [Leptolyngbya sp. FACHB-36]MBD2021531.1 ChaN family lipoprotein [Leptolyngbya sp. FACHB-36]